MASPITVDLEAKYNDRDIKRAMSDLKKLQAQGQTLGGKMQTLGASVKDFGDKMGRAGKSLTASVTLPLVGIGAAATAMAVEFESSMAKIVGLVGIAQEEVDGMKKAVIGLAGETAKSPKELADALFVVTSAGLRGADAMNALEFSAKAGAAGLGETNDIARAVAGSMNAYGSNVVDAAKATDVIVATARAGNFETSQFSAAIGRVLPFAKQAGASLEDMGGAVALLTRTNGDAAQSVTQVAALFRAFVVPTEEAKKALGAVGLSAADMRKAISEDGLPAALTMLDEKLGGNREQLGKLLGSSEAASAAFQILDADADSIAGTFGTVSDAAGMTDDAFGVVSETAGFKLQQAFTTLKASLIEFGDIIAPFVSQFAERISAMATAFQNLSPQTKQFIVLAGAIAAAVGPLLIIFGKLVGVVGTVIKVLGAITFAGSLLAIKVVAVVAAIAGIVIAFKTMYDRSESLRKAVSTLITTVQNIARTLIGDLLGAFKSVTGAGGDAGNILDRVAKIAGDVLAGALRILTGWWNILANGVRVAIKVFEIAFTAVRMVATLIRGAFVAAIDILFNKLGPVSTALRGLADGVRNAFTQVVSIVRSAFTNAGKFLESFINNAIGIVNKMIDAYNALEGIIPGVTRVTNIAEFTFKNMTASVQQAAYSTNNLANDIGGYVSQVLRGNKVTEAGVAQFDELGTAAEDAIPGLEGLGEGLAGSGGGSVASASEKAAEKLEKFKAKFTEVADSLKAKTKEIQDAYDGVIKSVQDVVMGAFDVSNIDPNRVGENGEKVGGTWLDGLASQAEKAVAFANKVSEVIKLGLQPGSPAFDTVMQVTKQQGEGLLDELIAGGVDAVNKSIDIVNSVTEAGKRVGTDAADQFHGTGLALAKQTEAAFAKRFGPDGPGFGKLNRLMSHLAKSMERTTTITVVTRHVSEGIPGRRFGGPVAAGSPYIVGEAGPELFVPTVQGRIVPNHDITGSMTGAPRAAAMGGGATTINLTVNAGMGTQGAEVGRQIVDALKAYERRNGPVYVTA